MKYLVIEAVGINPHLETAGEVVLRFVEEGHLVQFVFVGEGLPWVDCAFPSWLKWFGCSLEKRVAQFEAIIANRGARIIGCPQLSEQGMRACRMFSDGFSGRLKDLKAYRYGCVQLGMGVASSLISWAGDSQYDVVGNRQVARRALLAAAMTYERALVAIQSERPDAVVTFNGRFATCRAIVEAAATAQVPVLRHERGAVFDKFELFSEPLHSFAYVRRRIMEAWERANPDTREEVGHSFFARRRSGDGIGWYSFVKGQVHGNVPERVPGVRRVVYFSSSDDEYAAISDTVEPGCWGEQLETVHALIKVCEGYSDLELIVRVHPHIRIKSTAERTRWGRIRGRNLRVIGPDSKVDSYGLLDSADVVVTYGSTIGIEATYWGKPSILLGPSTYAGIDACFEPRTELDLARLLAGKDRIYAQPRERCLPYGHYYLTYGKQYSHYNPESLSAGTFLGHRLDWDVFPIRLFRKFGLGGLYNRIIQVMR